MYRSVDIDKSRAWPLHTHMTAGVTPASLLFYVAAWPLQPQPRGCCSCPCQPLTASLLFPAAAWMQVALLLSLISRLFPFTSSVGGVQRVKEYHKSVKDWMTDKKRAATFFADERLGCRILADRTSTFISQHVTLGSGLSTAAGNNSRGEDGSADVTPGEAAALLAGLEYSLRHAVAHHCLHAASAAAAEAAGGGAGSSGGSEAAAALRHIVLNIGFWERAYAAGAREEGGGGGGLSSYINEGGAWLAGQLLSWMGAGPCG